MIVSSFEKKHIQLYFHFACCFQCQANAFWERREFVSAPTSSELNSSIDWAL